MQAADVLDELRKRPFEPLRLHLTDGTMVEIRHPELVIVFPSKMIVALPGSQQPQPADRYDVVSLAHVMRLTPLNSPAQPSSN